MKGYRPVVDTLESYWKHTGYINVSIITHFEILNGLFIKDANKQLSNYQEFISQNVIVNVDRNSIETSAQIVAYLQKTGQPIGYLDTLIAGIAIENDMVLITNNTHHFSRIPNLVIDNWV